MAGAGAGWSETEGAPCECAGQRGDLPAPSRRLAWLKKREGRGGVGGERRALARSAARGEHDDVIESAPGEEDVLPAQPQPQVRLGVVHASEALRVDGHERE